jgi:NAD(P)-dependent dehydrogenase (short-subunit alcohol dehydrogenase family)
MKELRGRVAAVTGAASGIGRALALALAEEGCALSLCDVDEPGLAETAARTADRVKTSIHRVDVASRQEVFAWADATIAEHGRVHLLVNNAGVTLGARIATMLEEDLAWLLGINFWGVVHGTQAFLPHLRASGEGHVVNLSSVFGLMGFPGQGAYCASKFAVRGFTETLRIELEAEGAPVGVTCVHPGGVRTNIARASRIGAGETDVPSRDEIAAGFDAAARTTAGRAARIILRGVRRNRPRVYVGPDAHVVAGGVWLLGAAYQRLLARVARRRMASS